MSEFEIGDIVQLASGSPAWGNKMSEFEIGDIVQLASGSPRMTVFSISKGRAGVVWSHYATGVVREQRISLKALVKSAVYVGNRGRRSDIEDTF